MNFINKILDRSRRIIYQYWGSRFGHGCRVSKAEWNEEYRQGKWNVLKESHEQEHYEALTSLCISWGGRIQNIGCRMRRRGSFRLLSPYGIQLF